MRLLEFLYHLSGAIMLLCSFVNIGMTFYLGRTKMKEVDQLVLGHTIAHDSIFYQLLRFPQYGGAFSSFWLARRTKLLYLRDHFDPNFQRPFIITFYILATGGISMVLLIILDQFS